MVTKLVLKDRFQQQYDRAVERAAAQAEPGEEPEDVDIEFGDSAYENMLPTKYEELETTDIKNHYKAAGTWHTHRHTKPTVVPFISKTCYMAFCGSDLVLLKDL